MPTDILNSVIWSCDCWRDVWKISLELQDSPGHAFQIVSFRKKTLSLPLIVRSE